MNEAHENQFMELDSVKTEIEPNIYDDVVAESSTPAEEQTSYKTYLEPDSVKTEIEPTIYDDVVAKSSTPAVEQSQESADLENACQRDMVVFRRMLFFLSAVAIVALLTAAVALFVAISAMKGKHYYAYSRGRQVPSVRKCTRNDRLMALIYMDIGQSPSVRMAGHWPSRPNELGQ